MKDYIESLDDKGKLRVKFSKSDKIFKFGGGERLPSIGQFKIPITLAGKQVILVTDVVKSDLPLLLSKKAMKAAHIKLDLEKDCAEIFGQNIILNETSSGHYCVPIDNYETSTLDFACVVNLHELN